MYGLSIYFYLKKKSSLKIILTDAKKYQTDFENLMNVYQLMNQWN